MKRSWAAAIAVFVSLCPSLVRATVGGMEYAEPLGWDAAHQKAFFLVQSVSEAGRGPFVIYFDLGGVSPDRPVQVGWSKGGGDEDSLSASRLESLRRRLRPLIDIPGQTVFHYSRIVGEDSVASLDGDTYFKRYRIIVSDHQITDGSFEVTTLCDPDVRMIRRYRVGKDGPMFGILSFRGVPWEMCYETQVPVLLSSPSPPDLKGTPRKVEWIRWE